LIDVQGVDFIRVPVTDIEAAKDFYGRVLGLPDGPSQDDDWVEYQAGNVTLAVMTPETHGDEFAPLTAGVVRLSRPRRRGRQGAARGRRRRGQGDLGLGRLQRRLLQRPGRQSDHAAPPLRAP
jgi:catechol 2,3-dioxygenase-like lactoylglutathione lyase family enzyme